MLNPIDIVVFVDIALQERDGRSWTQVEVARRVGVSQSSIHRSLAQLSASALYRGTTRSRRFVTLVVNALDIVYPAVLGPPTRGVLTAQAATLGDVLASEHASVWAHEEGESYGVGLEPLHPRVPSIAMAYPDFHKVFALMDVFRIGRARDRRVAEPRLADVLGVRDERDRTGRGSSR